MHSERRMLSDPTLQAWWNYRREPQFGADVSSIRVPMPDGIELDCDLIRPSTDGELLDGPFPGLLVEFTPYALVRELWNQEATWFARRGYVALVGNVRGTGKSSGIWQHAMSSQDGRDAASLVEWLADQPFCDGRIGALGESYGGQTSYGVAVERAPHLRAVAPMQSPGNLYDDVIYPGGIKTTERGDCDNWPPIAQMLSAERIDAEAEYRENRTHPTFDEYWQDRALMGRVRDVEVPILAVGGWQDGYFRSGALTLIEEALDRTWAFYGPWPHLPPQSYDEPPTEGQLPGGVLLAWFDRWVREETGVPIPDDPTFCSFEGPEGIGQGWQLLDRWIPDGDQEATWVLGSDGVLAECSAEGSIELRQPADPGEPDASFTWSSPALEQARVLLGWPVLTFDATLSAPDAHFFVELFDSSPDGATEPVASGFLKASHRTSHLHPQVVPVGSRGRYRIRLRAAHWRFASGHRVQIRVSGGANSLLTPVSEAVTVCVHFGDCSTLVLPGFGVPRASDSE